MSGMPFSSLPWSALVSPSTGPSNFPLAINTGTAIHSPISSIWIPSLSCVTLPGGRLSKISSRTIGTSSSISTWFISSLAACSSNSSGVSSLLAISSSLVLHSSSATLCLVRATSTLSLITRKRVRSSTNASSVCLTTFLMNFFMPSWLISQNLLRRLNAKLRLTSTSWRSGLASFLLRSSIRSHRPTISRFRKVSTLRSSRFHRGLNSSKKAVMSWILSSALMCDLSSCLRPL
mmetsp:Transcript_25639/g.72588  ORF Transcript_25639/g.72588 Transcript_25639/m.72588 type:complete len:234 (+) Transcript_25639:1269-1970(+)